MPPSVPTRRPAQIGERAKLSGVGRADAQHLAKLIIRKGDRVAGAPRRRVLDAAQADVGVAARDRLIDRCKGDLDEARLAAQPPRDQLGDLDVEADDARRVGRVGLDVTARRPRRRPPIGSPPEIAPKAWQRRPRSARSSQRA